MNCCSWWRNQIFKVREWFDLKGFANWIHFEYEQLIFLGYTCGSIVNQIYNFLYWFWVKIWEKDVIGNRDKATSRVTVGWKNGSEQFWTVSQDYLIGSDPEKKICIYVVEGSDFVKDFLSSIKLFPLFPVDRLMKENKVWISFFWGCDEMGCKMDIDGRRPSKGWKSSVWLKRQGDIDQ